MNIPIFLAFSGWQGLALQLAQKKSSKILMIDFVNFATGSVINASILMSVKFVMKEILFLKKNVTTPVQKDIMAILPVKPVKLVILPV